MGINFSFNIRRKTTYKYNGVEYGSFGEMPEEARRIIAANAPEAARAAAEADEDRELEDQEEPADREIPAGRRTRPAPPLMNSASRPPALPWGGWQAGVLALGLLFLFFGTDLAYRIFRTGNYHPFFIALGLLCLVCGAGLVSLKRWARPLTLVFAPLAAFALLAFLHRARGGGRSAALLALGTCAAAFIWLLLPPVKRLFVPARQPITGRRLAAAAPPPRRISRPLELAVLFGNPSVLLCWFISLLVFVPMLDKLRGIVGGLREGLTAFSLPWLALPGAFIFSVAAAAFCGRWAFRWSRLQLDQLVNWPLCHGKLISKVMISDGDSEISRMKFEYEVGGRKYTNISDMNSASALEDEAEEPLLYDPAKPSRSMLVDALPASVILDGSGGLTSRRPFMGYFYAALPLLLLTAMAAAAFR